MRLHRGICLDGDKVKDRPRRQRRIKKAAWDRKTERSATK